MKRISILVSMFIALLSLSACGENHEWRQKTILEVETPAGTVTGSSVAQMSVRWFGKLELMLSNGAGLSTGVRGEAAFVEVAPGRFLFALFKELQPFQTTELFREAADGRESRSITARLEHIREKRLVPPLRYPMLVTFDDINDPKTVKLVDPANLAATFGEGFALKSISVEITDEEVTEGKVERVLGWLPDYYGRRLDGERFGTLKSKNQLANSLASGAFDTVK